MREISIGPYNTLINKYDIEKTTENFKLVEFDKQLKLPEGINTEKYENV